MIEIGTFVVITTDCNSRGVFGGVLEAYDNETGAVTLSSAQMCVHWSSATKGVLGLAAGGPAKGSKITESVPKLELVNVTAVMEATDEARKAWEAQPWG